MQYFKAVIFSGAVLMWTGCASENAKQEEKGPEATQQEVQSAHVVPAEQGDESRQGIRNISVMEFDKRRLSSSGNVFVIDVRTPEEMADGIVPAAIKLEYGSDNFEKELATLDKSKEYLVYCAAGARSGKTAQIMQDMGFENVYNLHGGYEAWKEAQSK